MTWKNENIHKVVEMSVFMPLAHKPTSGIVDRKTGVMAVTKTDNHDNRQNFSPLALWCCEASLPLLVHGKIRLLIPSPTVCANFCQLEGWDILLWRAAVFIHIFDVIGYFWMKCFPSWHSLCAANKMVKINCRGKPRFKKPASIHVYFPPHAVGLISNTILLSKHVVKYIFINILRPEIEGGLLMLSIHVILKSPAATLAHWM